MADDTLFWPIINFIGGTFQGLAPAMTESNIYGYQEIVLVVYVLSYDILLKPIRPQVERIGWPIIDGGR